MGNKISFFKDLGLGVRTYFSAIGFIFRHGLWWYLIFPIFLNVLLFLGLSALGTKAADALTGWLTGLVQFEDPDVWWSALLGGTIGWLFAIALKIITFLIFIFFGGYVILAIMSPVFTLLSQKTETLLCGTKYPFDGDQFMRDIWRAILIVTRNALVQFLLVLALYLCSFIPVIDLLVPFAMFAITAYFYGFSFIDYSMERQKLTIKQSVRFVRRHKGIAIGNGAAFAGLLIIPWCGVSLAGFAAIIAAVGATLALHERGVLKKTKQTKP